MNDQLMLSVELAPKQGAAGARRPAPMSKKRRAILEYLRTNQTVTLAQATHLVGRDIYHNAEKHTGAVLSAMVKHGFIVRQKPGLFALPNTVVRDGPLGGRSL